MEFKNFNIISKKLKYIKIFNPKKKLVGGAPLHVKRAETPLSTSFFLGLKCFIIQDSFLQTMKIKPYL